MDLVQARHKVPPLTSVNDGDNDNTASGAAIGSTDGVGDPGAVGGGGVSGAMASDLASALYDLALNYVVRARILCSDAGEGSGLWRQEVYDALPEVAQLAR